MKNVSWLWLIFSVLGFSSPANANNSANLALPLITNGWYYWAPYQYMEGPQELAQLSGLDIELVSQITRLTGREVAFEQVGWRQHLSQLQDGSRHFASGATYTAERAEYVHYSIPYRYEENSLFTLRDKATRIQFNTIEELLAWVRRHDFTLAVTDGFIYADPLINAFIDDPQNNDLIVVTNSDPESMSLLLNGRVNGFLADRIVGANIIWRTRSGNRITEVPLNISTPIHLMFSKASVPFEVVEEFNAAIREYQHTTAYKNSVARHLAPIMFLKTIDSSWFRIAEMIGTIAFALSGVIIAIQQRATLLAAFIFAFLPSFGGGVIRDVVFGISPVYVLRAPLIFLVVLSVVVVAYGLHLIAGHRLGHFFESLVPKALRNGKENVYLVLTDALGLAAFTVSGVFVTLVAEVQPFWLWAPFFAFLTGAGGGILRDVVARRKAIVAFSGAPYGEWAALWGFMFSMYLLLNAESLSQDIVGQGVVIVMVGVFCCRILSYFINMPNLVFSKRIAE